MSEHTLRRIAIALESIADSLTAQSSIQGRAQTAREAFQEELLAKWKADRAAVRKAHEAREWADAHEGEV